MAKRFEQTRRRWITVYVDGACLGNGQAKPFAGMTASSEPVSYNGD